MKEHWFWLYDDLKVRYVGEFDFENEWDEMYDAAIAFGESLDGAEPLQAVCLDDLMEMSANIQEAINRLHGLRDEPWLLAGALIDAGEVRDLYKLVRQHRDSEFLAHLRVECEQARKHWKGK